MDNEEFVRIDRLIPEIPPANKKLRLIIDSDVGNEIDDFYAIGLALASPDRFNLLGICGAHYTNARFGSGPGSIAHSVKLTHDLLKAAGMDDKYPVLHGSPPIQYFGFPIESEASKFIITEAKKVTPEDPLWVVVLGASSTTASALLSDPSIADNMRVVFHVRSDWTWPQRSVQYNVFGDIHAARSILESRVPLVWFDTGTQIKCPYEITKKHLAPLNSLGRYLHDYRDNDPYFATPQKGFFDMGDIAFLIDPSICKMEITKAPRMDQYMYFDFQQNRGKMLRVFDIENDAVWNMLFSRLKKLGPDSDER